MIILGIESSCDDTSVSLLDCSKNGFIVIEEKTASQIDIHNKYGGVVPEIAGRAHAEAIIPLIEDILHNNPKPDAIAVTAGPGLITGLLVGVEAAKTLSYATDIPLIAVNHIEGHIHSVELGENRIQYPTLALVVSGGHTALIHIPKQGEYKHIGSTKDDAAGECFDKVAKLLSLPYPGGPQISLLAKEGDPNSINLPRPMLHQDNFDFSFSGLKTASLYELRDNKKISKQDFCASFQQAIVDVLTKKTIRAVEKYQTNNVILAGGVSANDLLRTTLQTQLDKTSTTLLYPQKKYAMDNATMIGVAGYYKAEKKQFSSYQDIQADPNWKIYPSP